MAAPRKYSQAQRDALWRLHVAGMTSGEVAKAAEEGKTGLPPFSIPDRSVRAIIDELAKAADAKLPTKVIELESTKAMERAPARAARIVEGELNRLEAKQGSGRLTDKEIDRLPKLATYSVRIQRLLQNPETQQGRAGRAGRAAGSQPAPESAMEKLAREQREEQSAEGQPSLTHTHRDEDDSAPSHAESTPGAEIPPVVARLPEGRQPQPAPASGKETAREMLRRIGDERGFDLVAAAERGRAARLGRPTPPGSLGG